MWYEEKQEYLNENLRFLLLETISKYSLNFILTFYNIY